MSIIEKLSVISNVMTNLMNFVNTNELVKTDFNEYLSTIGQNQKISANKLQSMMIPYIFERRLTDKRKTIIQLFIENTKNIQDEEKNILEALSSSFSSVFEIKRAMGNGFEFYNLLNEKVYKVISLVKMSNYPGVGTGQYALARIFKSENEYFLLELSNVMPYYRKEEVYKYAIAKIIEQPEDAYLDNPKKVKMIEEQVKLTYDKFIKCFDKEEIITTNHYVDNLINLFNLYCDGDENLDKKEIEKNIHSVATNKFFYVEEFKNSYQNFMEKSLDGFSSHNADYDIAIICDKDLGLYVIPFYETFTKLFEIEDYKTISGYKDCVKSFLSNDKVPAAIIKRVANKNKCFIDRINEILATNYTLNELLQYYKADSLEMKIYSSTSVLYTSRIFEEMMSIVSNNAELEQKKDIDYSNVGRNDLCPCGSGKKYKKCCMLLHGKR